MKEQFEERNDEAKKEGQASSATPEEKRSKKKNKLFIWPFIIGGIVALILVAVVIIAVICGGAHRHSFGEWYVAKEATCASEGVEERACECDEKETRPIARLPHTEVTDAAVDPTCSETGLTEGSHCSVCGAVIVAQETVDKLPHSYDDENDTECNDCGDVRVPECTHENTEIIPGRDASCSDTGLTEGEKCTDCGETIVEPVVIPTTPHSYDDENDNECNDCGGVREPECTHENTEIIPGKDASCSDTGLTEGEKCTDCGETIVEPVVIPTTPHSYDDENDTECNDCGDVREPACTHENTETIPGRGATCTETGLTVGEKCADCGKVLVVQTVIPTVSHTYDNIYDAECNDCGHKRDTECAHTETEVILGRAASCIETGLTDGARCLSCGEVTVAQTVIPLSAHTEVEVPAVPATCVRQGLTDGVKCSVCNTFIIAQTATPKVAHVEVDVPAVPATCMRKGLTDGRKCSVCNTFTVAQAETPRLPHVEVDVPAVAATCVRRGLTEGRKCSVCNTFTLAQTETPRAPHTEVTLPAVEATCTESGLTEGRKCSVCDTVTLAQTETPRASHTEQIIPAVAATCTEMGLTEGVKCSVCETILVAQKKTAKLPHTYDDKYDESCNDCGFIRDAECAHTETEVVSGYAATCTQKGLTDGTACKKCGDILISQIVIPMLPHDEVVDPAAPATCTKTGLTAGRHCSVCSAVIVAQSLVPTLPHSPVVDAAVAPTCTATGLTEGRHCSVCSAVIVAQNLVNTIPHTEVVDEAVAPTCTKTGLTEGRHCSVCSAVIVAQNTVGITSHTAEVDAAVAPTCTKAGLTEGMHCSVCDAVIIAQNLVPALPHSPIADAAVAPTCTEMGLTEGSHCSVCSTVIIAQSLVPTLPHSPVVDAAVAPTCMSTGRTEGSHCSVCNTVITAQNLVDKLPHTEVVDAAVAPTCTETGLTAGSHCSVCNSVVKAQHLVDRLPHTEVIDAAVAPTCAEAGRTEGSHCSVCGTVIKAQSQVSALPHTEVADAAVEPTCTETGLTAGSHCSVCNTVITAQNLVAKLPHTKVIDAALEPTCTETGLTAGSHCSVCGTVIEAQGTVFAKGHDYTETVFAPTCTEKGYTLYDCVRCDDTYVGNEVSTVAHKFVDKYCVYCGGEEFGEINYDISWYNPTSDSFEITTREQLAGLSYLVAKRGVSFSGKRVSLGADIDLLGAEWIPIGTESRAFAGDFDGCGFTVSALKVTEQLSYAGLFGRVTGTLQSFTLSDAFVSAADGGAYIAIACGYTSGTLSDISVSGCVEASGSSYVGGVAGRITESGTATFENLSNSADVSGGSHVGGVCGEMYNSTDGNWDYTLTLKGFTNSGSVSGTDFVGGIFGRLYAKNDYDDTKIITDSLVNEGDVHALGLYAGGIVGSCVSDHSSSAISGAVSNADVVGLAYVGGIVGNSTVTVKNCTNEGSTVTATGYYTSGGKNYAYLGGYVGYGASVENCINTVDITYTELGRCVGGIAGLMTGSADFCTNKAKIVGKDWVGGIAGAAEKSGGGSYYNLTNTGDVTGENYVGGIYGDVYNWTDGNWTYTVDITNLSNSGSVSGVDYVGGLCGRIYGYNDYKSTKVVGSNLVNTGNVSGRDTVGGIAGYAYSDSGSSSISGCVNSGSVTGESLVADIVAKKNGVSFS